MRQAIVRLRLQVLAGQTFLQRMRACAITLRLALAEAPGQGKFRVKALLYVRALVLAWLALPVLLMGTVQSAHGADRAPDPLTATPVPVQASPAETQAANSSWGTAFVVAPGYLVTAYHVVQKRTQIRVGPVGTTSTGATRWLMAELVKTDPVNDLALLKVAETLPALKLNPSPSIPIGLEAYVIGYPQPRIQGASRKITAGIVNGYRNPSLKLPESGMLQISAEVSQGNSGGPVIAPDGTVIGMIQKKINSARLADKPSQDILINVNYALRSSQIVDFLRSENIPFQTQSVLPNITFRPYQLFEMHQQSVLAVIGRGQTSELQPGDADVPRAPP